MRSITSFVCQECGYEAAQWLGKCPECGVWNSLKEFKVHPFDKLRTKLKVESKTEDIKPKTLAEIRFDSKDRLSTGFSEMDGVLGGGIVRGSVILLAGDPGIGKSTLLLQVGLTLASANSEVLYVSGEESIEQIKLRALRITESKKTKDQFKLLSTNDTDGIAEVVDKTKPSFFNYRFNPNYGIKCCWRHGWINCSNSICDVFIYPSRKDVICPSYSCWSCNKRGNGCRAYGFVSHG